MSYRSQNRREGKIPAEITAGSAQVVKPEPGNLGGRIEVTARFLRHRVRTPLHHPKRNYRPRKLVAAVVRAVQRQDIGCQDLLRKSTKRQPPSQNQNQRQHSDWRLRAINRISHDHLTFRKFSRTTENLPFLSHCQMVSKLKQSG